ncbi:MAG: hypothetical protein H0V02_01325 [Nocardioidaceae bacterium]|nr:hypothetical protein [Nocardioidaceae bacterium]
MTTARTATPGSPLALLVRASLVPSLVGGAVCGLFFLFVDGSAGLAGAGLGAVLVIGFFCLGRFVLEVMRVTDAGVYLVIALLTYCLQVVALLALFAGFQRNPSWETHFSTTAIGVTVIACTLVWTTGLVLASRRERTPLYDLEPGAR